MSRPKLIKSFKTSQELDDNIASILISEFQKPGLVMLPVGSTFEKGIYPKVNEFFAFEEYELRDTKNQDSVFVKKNHKVSKGLSITHLDELANEEKNKFSSSLKRSLSNVLNQVGERFFEIDIENIKTFDSFINNLGGPRLIVLGLGSDPAIAHVAFIGEEFLNTVTAKVKLSKKVAKIHGVEEAVTIGTDIFKSNNLEQIIVVVKGKSKAESLAAAYKDPDTGLGFLIAYHFDKLKIYADDEALVALP